MSFWASKAARSGHEEKTEGEFQRRVDLTVSAIRARMLAYEYVLRGGAALFGTRADPTRAEWAAYVAALRLERDYPGIQAMGFAQRVTPADRAAHVGQLRANGFPEYDIRPAGLRPEYFAIRYNEPATARNLRVIGFDMNSEPVRRAAMERARDTGEASASGKVALQGEPFRGQQPYQAGLLMYVPVYRKGVAIGTIDERRGAILGFVYGAFRIRDLMQGVLGSSALRDIDMELYDGEGASEDALFIDPAGELRATREAPADVRHRTVKVDIAGRPWTLYFRAEAEFEDAFSRRLPAQVLAAGLSASFLLFAVMILLVRGRARAVELALHDSLTGLFNRRYLDGTMPRELPRAQRDNEPIGVVLADLDHFKRLNDTFGHDAGDHVLRQIGDLFRRQSRRGDLACRYGGEEFVLVLPGATLNIASARADELRRAAEALRTNFKGRMLGTVTLSAGVAAFPQHGAAWDELLASADRALYRAKQGGRNRIEIAEKSR